MCSCGGLYCEQNDGWMVLKVTTTPRFAPTHCLLELVWSVCLCCSTVLIHTIPQHTLKLSAPSQVLQTQTKLWRLLLHSSGSIHAPPQHHYQPRWTVPLHYHPHPLATPSPVSHHHPTSHRNWLRSSRRRPSRNQCHCPGQCCRGRQLSLLHDQQKYNMGFLPRKRFVVESRAPRDTSSLDLCDSCQVCLHDEKTFRLEVDRSLRQARSKYASMPTGLPLALF